MIKLISSSLFYFLIFSSLTLQNLQSTTASATDSKTIEIDYDHPSVSEFEYSEFKNSNEQQAKDSSKSTTSTTKKHKKITSYSPLLKFGTFLIGIPLAAWALFTQCPQLIPYSPKPPKPSTPKPTSLPTVPLQVSIQTQTGQTQAGALPQPVTMPQTFTPTTIHPQAPVPQPVPQNLPPQVQALAMQAQHERVHYAPPFVDGRFHPYSQDACIQYAKKMINTGLFRCLNTNINVIDWITNIPTSLTIDANFIELMIQQFDRDKINPDDYYIQITPIPNNSTIIFVGKIQGDLDATCKMIQNWKDRGFISADNEILQPNRTFFVFLGDYILSNPLYPDPNGGPRRQKTLLSSLFALKLLNPENVILMRGGHDDPQQFEINGYHDMLNGLYREYPQIVEYLCKSLVPGACLVFEDRSVLTCWNDERLCWDNLDFTVFENVLQTRQSHLINVELSDTILQGDAAYQDGFFNVFMFANHEFDYRGVFRCTSYISSGFSYIRPSQNTNNTFCFKLNSSKNHNLDIDQRLSDELGFSYAILENGNISAEWRITHVCQNGEQALDL